ncbi:MAG: Co2+/Mg2+ efflux protein ApaG [Hyphomicrobiales bacterium]|nr:Co2+/Mg2+ efflux protein ApaG [Hyphomicrobiales bacterium]MDE2018072.1 Co2+/Mg2+ efflux protein ApaG [Hyphomicrobiales bacterium]
MYRAVTRGIQVTAMPEFSPERSSPAEGEYFFVYTIEIANLGDRTVQLTHRRWLITDGAGDTREVRGPGVVGETPTLRPGETFRYSSGCPLATPNGVMRGGYRMVDEDGDAFEVAIPAFSLDSPFGTRTLN